MPTAQPQPVPDDAARGQSALRCPRCGWRDVRPSRAKSFLDRLLAAIGLPAYRCRSCGARFRRSRPARRASR